MIKTIIIILILTIIISFFRTVKRWINEDYYPEQIMTIKDMIKHLRDTADRLEQKQDFETPENNIY